MRRREVSPLLSRHNEDATHEVRVAQEEMSKLRPLRLDLHSRTDREIRDRKNEVERGARPRTAIARRDAAS